jgi:hypothetical protein
LGHAGAPNELLEVAGDKLGSVIRDDPGFRLRTLFLGSLQKDFDLRVGHGLAQIPVQQEATVSLQDTAQVVESTGQVDVGNIDAPVLVRLRQLLKPRPFAPGLALLTEERFLHSQLRQDRTTDGPRSRCALVPNLQV